MTAAIIIVSILVTALLLWIIFIAAPAYCMYSIIFGKGKCRPHESTDLNGTYYEEYADEIRAEIAKLKNRFSSEASITADDGATLRADLAEHGQRKTAILVHGYHSSPTNNCYAYGNLLYENGYDLILIHQRSHGKSEGKHSTFGLLEQYDLLNWLKWSRQRNPENDILIVGVSMGATTIALALDKINDTKIKAAVLDCGFTSPREQMSFYCRRRHIPLAVLPLIRLFVRHSTNQDINKSTLNSLSKSELPILFLHGTNDDAVPCEFSMQNFKASSASDKELILVDNANHTLAVTVGGKTTRQAVIDFLNKQFH